MGVFFSCASRTDSAKWNSTFGGKTDNTFQTDTGCGN